MPGGGGGGGGDSDAGEGADSAADAGGAGAPGEFPGKGGGAEEAGRNGAGSAGAGAESAGDGGGAGEAGQNDSGFCFSSTASDILSPGAELEEVLKSDCGGAGGESCDDDWDGESDSDVSDGAEVGVGGLMFYVDMSLKNRIRPAVLFRPSPGRASTREEAMAKVFDDPDDGDHEYMKALKFHKKLKPYEEGSLFSILRPICFDIRVDVGVFLKEKPKGIYHEVFAGEMGSLRTVRTDKLLLGEYGRFFRVDDESIMGRELTDQAELNKFVGGVGDFFGLLHFVLGLAPEHVKIFGCPAPFVGKPVVDMDYERIIRLPSDATAAAKKVLRSLSRFKTIKSFPWPGDTGWEVFETSYRLRASQAGKVDLFELVVSRMAMNHEPDAHELFEQECAAFNHLAGWQSHLQKADRSQPVIVLLVGCASPEAGYARWGMLSAAIVAPCTLADVVSCITAFGTEKYFLVFMRANEVLSVNLRQWAVANKVTIRVFRVCNVLLYKVAGAAARDGCDLGEIVSLLQELARSTFVIRSVKEAVELHLPRNDYAGVFLVVNGPKRQAVELLAEVEPRVQEFQLAVKIRYTFTNPEVSITSVFCSPSVVRGLTTSFFEDHQPMEGAPPAETLQEHQRSSRDDPHHTGRGLRRLPIAAPVVAERLWSDMQVSRS